MTTKTIRIAGINLHLIDEGSGPPVLLLHGFPNTSQLWHHQLPALLDAGFRVVAPDLRGFGESDKPAEVEAYAIRLILQDILGLLDKLEIERTHLVGHDWGAAVSWLLAALYPDRVARLVVLSVGHPLAFRQAGLAQYEKSWYMLLFQFPDLAEEILSRDNWRFFREWTRHHPETDQWIEALSRPGALTAGLNWYRANAGPKTFLRDPRPLPQVQAPTLALWSSGDAYLTETQIVRSSEWVAGPWRYERLEGASHWLQLDRPHHLNPLLLDFLTGLP